MIKKFKQFTSRHTSLGIWKNENCTKGWQQFIFKMMNLLPVKNLGREPIFVFLEAGMFCNLPQILKSVSKKNCSPKKSACIFLNRFLSALYVKTSHWYLLLCILNVFLLYPFSISLYTYYIVFLFSPCSPFGASKSSNQERDISMDRVNLAASI